MGHKWDKRGGGKHWVRVKSAMTTKTTLTPPPPPPLYGLPKDHKPPKGREDLGHPVKPVCGATESMNGPLSDILTDLLSLLGDSMDKSIDALCLSMEEMYHCLELRYIKDWVCKYLIQKVMEWSIFKRKHVISMRLGHGLYSVDIVFLTLTFP